MILKTPFGYIDLFGTWEGWTLIGVVLAPGALLWWMEFGKVKCPVCKGKKYVSYFGQHGLEYDDCPVCHGTGRVRRRYVSHFLQIASGAIRGK